MLSDISFDSIIDIGCGEGTLLKDIISWKKNITVAGVDISETALTIAKKKVKEGKFYLLDIQRDSLDERFDLVICSEVLEHLFDDVQALYNMFKMARNYLLIVTLQGKMRKIEEEAGHVRNYTKEDLLKKLHKAGFKEIKIKEWGFPFYSPFYRSF
jgi:2-polyprenyl-3-methyl-5-hydroxy-6-metoxy-1,4-benzoquinol methylase